MLTMRRPCTYRAKPICSCFTAPAKADGDRPRARNSNAKKHRAEPPRCPDPPLPGADLSVAVRRKRALVEGLPRNCLDSGADLFLGQIGIDAPMECTGKAYAAVTASALVVGTAILVSAILFCGS
jgi:hypothetical protein